MEWKTIIGYEGIYEVSEYGDVRRISYDDMANSKKNKLPYVIKPQTDKDGYLRVTLVESGISKRYYCHRLVGLAFIENPLNKREINHKNGVKSCNYYMNIEWVTQSENRQHCLKYLNPKLRNNKLSKPVIQYDLNNNEVCKHLSAKEAGRQTGYSQGHISECCRGEMNTYKGFLWKYQDNSNDYRNRLDRRE